MLSTDATSAPEPYAFGASSTRLTSSALSATTAERLAFDVQRDFLDHISNDTLDALDTVLAPDCVLLFPGIRPVEGAALVRRMLRGIRRRYAVLSFQAILQLRSPDDILVVNSKVRGVRNDGVPYANDVISLIRLDRAGRVALISDYFKDTTFLEPAPKRPQANA